MIKQSCGDGITNGDEDFKDCGGSCMACEPTCSDGIQNNDEEDIDCGGTTCEPCPIDCVEDWSDYGPCSISCGISVGEKTRSWEHIVSTQYGGNECIEEEGIIETAVCDSSDLIVTNCPVDCEGQWSNWGECSHSCGTFGTSTRLFDVTQESEFGGANCMMDDNSIDDRSCNTDITCPIDCKGDWANWQCDATCGENIMATRYFQVQRQAKHGGVECEFADESAEQELCAGDCCLQDCAVTLTPDVPKYVQWGTVSGGDANRALGDYGTVVGGTKNTVEASYTTAAGGIGNRIISAFSNVVGGRAHVVAGRFSAVVGGAENTVLGKDSYAMGHDVFVKNCQKNTAVFGYHVDTSEQSCKVLNEEQQDAGCEGNTIQFCAEQLMFNGVDIGSISRRVLQEISPDQQLTLDALLNIEMKYRAAIEKVETRIKQVKQL
jgi:hypothetical protein